MFLNQLVEINEKGIVASSVNFGMMDDPETNLLLCEGFVFNYDPKKPDLSTVGIFDLLRRSYHSRNEPNIHLIIQQYGKGKSHFAVAIANFFKQPFDSPEVQGILHQVEMATSGKGRSLAEGLRLFKQNQRLPHLVICLSGDKGGNLKKQFLVALQQALEAEGITDALAQQLCKAPLRYLEGLDAEERAIAENYLKSIGNPDGDLECIINLLKTNNYEIISTVVEISRQFNRGFEISFQSELDTEDVLKDLLHNYCSGENARFLGILILVDELNYYLQSWAADQIGAGGMVLQNITNICETYKGKIALLSFTQIHPDRAVGISATVKDSYLKISSRLAPKDSTYDEPASSLELVLDNLIIQKENEPTWLEFHARWRDVLLAEARIAFEERIRIYKEKGWNLNEFHNHLSQGCFPLHPLTAYLLCNLDFTQDRTAIQFIKSYVKHFIQDEPVEKEGKLNYIYPTALVDTFIENFSNYSVYTHYKKALGLVLGSDDPDELTVLQALFLFSASGDKLAKSDREEHQEVLASLTGLSHFRLQTALDKLEKTRDIIYYRPETKLYRFFEGINPTGIEEEIEEKIKDTSTSIADVVVHCNSRIKEYLADLTITATQFVKDNKLVGTDWQFEYKIYSIDGFIEALKSDQTLRGIKERGILVYVLAETQEELQEFRQTVDDCLLNSPIKKQIAVAISLEETGDLARVLLKIKTLLEKESSQKRLFGVAYEQLLQRWREQVKTQLERVFKSCTYHCVALEKIPPLERSKPQRVISALLQELYPFVPPVDEIDKMRRDHTTGSKIVGFASKHVFSDSLTPQILPPDQAYKTVIETIFVSRWGLLKKTSQKYIVQEPTHEKICAAWDKISQIANLEGQPEKIVELEKIWKVLSDPPYGYSEYNFTILLSGWLAFHRQEVALQGPVKLSAKKGELVSKQIQSLKDWANPSTDILQKPIAFVHDWVVKGKSKLIRRQKVEMPGLPVSPTNYDQAQQYLQAVATFLESIEPEPGEVARINKNREQVSAGVEQINKWFQPVVEAEALASGITLDALLQLYPQLLQHPPAIDLRLDVISVQPAPQQRDRASQALTTVSEKIAKLVEAQSQRSESLATTAACTAYKVEIQGIIDQITLVKDLPPHLIETLQNAIQTATRRLTEIGYRARISECLSEIQGFYKTIDNDSTQQDYIRTRAEINILQPNIPDVAPEAAEVRQILQNIDQRYRELFQQIEIWEERSSGVTSPNHILELIKEINRQSRRFTEEPSKQKISALQQHLEKELLRIRDRDDAEKLFRSELLSAQQKLQRIRDLSVNKLSEAFQVYQELINSSFPATEQAVFIEEYQKKLDIFKVHGRTAICDNFARIYNSKPNRLEDCEPLKEQLHRSKNLLANDTNFADVRANIEQAIAEIEVQRHQLEEKQKQADDRQIMQDICQYKQIKKLNNIQLGEEAIKQVENLRERLNNPEQFTDEIVQIVDSIVDIVNAYKQRLASIQNRIATVDNLAAIARISTESAELAFIFKDSADYPAYQALKEKIYFLKDDLERLQHLEERYQQSDSIASCQDVLEMIGNERGVLHVFDRFQERLSNLEENLCKKIQNYTNELGEIEHNQEDITTAIQAQKLQEELLKNSSRYLNSEAEKQYKAIGSKLKMLIELLQINESAKVKTWESCQAQLDRLQQWQNTNEVTPNLRDRVHFLCAELEQKKAQILQQQQAAAQNWLKDLETQAAKIYQLLDDTDKFEAASELLKQIETEKYQYTNLLNLNQQESLECIERQCFEEQGKHKANQIVMLFRQLPRLQRQSLYERLEQYLSDETEDGNG